MAGMTRTTCPYCGVGCGLHAEGDPPGTRIVPDPAHPANRGRVCSKGAALAETLGLDGRLLHPEIGGRRCSWDEALDTVARRFADVIARHGPDAVAFYVSGQLLTEDYYVANKLMKGFIGSANIDTNSRLCMASAVAGQKRAFGADLVPGCYADLDEADLVVLVGSNAAWCHPVLHQRIVAARRVRGTRVVVIDPRRTATCEQADLHLALRPGSDAVLFSGLLVYLQRVGAVDRGFVERHTHGFDAALAEAVAAAPDIADVAQACGLPAAQVARFFALFAASPRAVTAFSQGVNQSSSGTDKVNAIINVHLATGRIGRPGAGPLSLTGQPNAMGGREVGGLASTLAAHMEFTPENVERLRRFWDAPQVASAPGPKAVEMFGRIADGRIKAVWIMGTNPVVSLPAADRVRAALRDCEFVVVSECVRASDTADCADVLLPAAAWGEKSGTVTNSERRISRQRAFLRLPGEARPDWWIVSRVAQRLGFSRAFAYDGPAEIFREHARLSGYENDGSRCFDISALATLDAAAYDALTPVQWPVTGTAPHGTARLFADGRFATADRRARFMALRPRLPAAGASVEYPLVLNTGRVRDQWHTMTRTGAVPRLSSHTPGPCVSVHPDDAAVHGLRSGDLVELCSTEGALHARAHLTDEQQRGTVFVPMHWNAQFASRARVGALVPAHLDPHSGQPESKHAPVRLRAWRPRAQGFALSRKPLAGGTLDYWVRTRVEGGWRTDFAVEADVQAWPARAWALLPGAGDWLEFFDPGAGRYRAARLREGRLEACLFIEAGSPVSAPAWLEALFTGEQRLAARTRHDLLAGAPAGEAADTSQPVCACFAVRRATLERAIAEQGLASVDALGAALGAGTGCGSCIPELRQLLAAAGRDEAAA